MKMNRIAYVLGFFSMPLWGHASSDLANQANSVGKINSQNENTIQEIIKDNRKGMQKPTSKANGFLQFSRQQSDDYEALASDETKFHLKSIDLVYIYANPVTVVDKIIRKKLQSFKNRTVMVKDLIAVMRDAEKEVAMAGYPMTRILIPAQDTPEKNAVIKLHVVSGYIEKVIMRFKVNHGASVSEAYKKKFIKLLRKKFWGLEGKSYVNAKEIGKTIQSLKQYYGLSIELFLSRGENSRAYNVHINGTIAPEYHIVSFNNGLSYNLDQWLGSYTYIKNDFKNWRSTQLVTSVSSSLKKDKNNYYRNVKTSYKYFDTDTTKNEYSASFFRTSSQLTRGGFKSTSNGHTLDYKRTYAWINTDQRTINLTGGISYDINKARNKNTAQYLYHDKVTFAVLGANMIQGSHQVNITVKRDTGFNRKITTRNDIPVSAQGVKAGTNITVLNYGYSKPLENQIFTGYQLDFSAQHTGGKALLSRQKFSGDGTLSKVRGFKHTSLAGDEGYVATNTFNIKPFAISEYGVAPYFAIAFSKVKRAKPTATERKSAKGRSVTLGAKTTVSGYQANMGFSKAKKKDYKNVSSTRFLFSISKPLSKQFREPKKDE